MTKAIGNISQVCFAWIGESPYQTWSRCARLPERRGVTATARRPDGLTTPRSPSIRDQAVTQRQARQPADRTDVAVRPFACLQGEHGEGGPEVLHVQVAGADTALGRPDDRGRREPAARGA